MGTQDDKQLSAKITDGIYIGNSIPQTDISAIVNLDMIKFDDVGDSTIFNFVLPNQELMPNEIPKTLAKLETIAKLIKELRDNNLDVLIICANGRNKCVLVAGYYLISRGGMKPDNVINFLETIYYSQAQRDEETADEQTRHRAMESDMLPTYSSEALKRQFERRMLKCLTMRSFCSVLKAWSR